MKITVNSTKNQSFKTVLQQFKVARPELPWFSPHASVFVIASPTARAAVGEANETWWLAAQQSGLMEINNHSMDHDYGGLTVSVKETILLGTTIKIPVMGAPAVNSFDRMSTTMQAFNEVVLSSKYIKGKIGAEPDLFAYPFGQGKPGRFIYNWMTQNEPVRNFVCEA